MKSREQEEEEEVVNVVEEEEEESVETLETQACCCWPRSAAPEKRAQDVRGTICFWGCSAFRGFHVKAEFEAALGVVVSRSFLDIFCIKVLILSQFRVSVSRLDMRCFCIKAEF